MDKSEGPHYFYQGLEFFACNGMITLIDTRLAGDSSKTADEYSWRIPPGDFMKRAIAAFIKEPDKYASKLFELRQLLDNAKEACKLAKRQGDPTDPNALRDKVKDRKPARIIMPSELPPMPGQRFTLDTNSNKARDILTKPVYVVPERKESNISIANAEQIRKTVASR